MTGQKVLEILERYERYFASIDVEATQFTDAEYASKHPEYLATLRHCRWMCQSAAGFVEQDREKAMRWMCYVQGVLNCTGHFSCYDLRDHSRSSQPAPVDPFVAPTDGTPRTG